MRKPLYLLWIGLVFISCKKRNNADAEGLQNVTISFANANMELPLLYKHVPVEELENLLVNSGGPDDLKQLQMKRFELVKAYPGHFIVYTDSINLENTIWFQKGAHFTLTKRIAQQYLGMLEQQLEAQWKQYGIDFDRMESNYISTKNGQIIKLKYKLKREDLARYTTQYVISTKTKTLGIIVNGIDSIDYEDNVRRLRIE